MGFRWLRTHDITFATAWWVAEPQPGKWVFDSSDFQRARAHGFKILGLLYRPPKWALGLTEAGKSVEWMRCLPKDMTLWDRYVRKTVGAFKPYVSAWELGNEVID